MATFFLTIYKDDTWRHQLGRFDFRHRAGFRAWTDRQNDELSSFKFRLPVGWELQIHEHRDRNSRYKAWRGTGRVVKVNKRDIPGFIHDDASGHSWVRLGHRTIQAAFNAIRENEASKFSLVRPGSVRMPDGHNGARQFHQQGIQRTAQGEFVVTGSAPSTGYVYFTNPQHNILKVLTPRRGTFNHLGGCQVTETILAAGYERLENGAEGGSVVLFFDVADPRRPVALRHLSLPRPRDPAGASAGAVGLAKLRGYWLLLVANWDAARLDFYRSNRADLRDPRARFGPTPLASWRASTDGLGRGSVDRNWEAYQNINLFSQIGARASLNDLWFVGMHTNNFPSQADWADLYHLRLARRGGSAGPFRVTVTKRGKKHFERSGSGPRFRNGAGFYLDKRVRAFEVYSCEAQLSRGGRVNRCNKWV